MFIQYVRPSQPPQPSHVVSGWAPASVMKDRYGGEFVRYSLSLQTPCLGVFVHAFCLGGGTSLHPVPLIFPWLRSQIAGTPITCQHKIHFNFIFPLWKGKSYQAEKHFPSETDLSHTDCSCQTFRQHSDNIRTTFGNEHKSAISDECGHCGHQRLTVKESF